MYVSLEINSKGRFTLLTHSKTIGISYKIKDEKEVRRLKKIVRKNLPGKFGSIVRTNAKDQPENILVEKTEYLHKIHTKITTRAQYARPPATLFPTGKNASVSQNLLECLPSDELE